MGCASSTPATAPSSGGTPVIDKNGKNERQTTADTEAMAVGPTHTMPVWNESTSSTSIKAGQLTLSYAAKSQRGRDPDNINKPNQDCYGTHHGEEFGDGDSDSSAFLAVYDGHGPHGELCSHFVRTKLPALLKDNMESKREQKRFIDKLPASESISLSVDDIHSSLLDAHVEVNEELRGSGIDDAHSGTTSVSVYLHDNRITVSNVGDSRIVLGTGTPGSSGGGGVQAVPLSRDHTPYRSDESARCTMMGARILSFGQINPAPGGDDDDVEDPPRVWAAGGNYPGTAFTRSIGDSVAERLGVFAEPEMVTLPISKNERVLVLASDGVYDVVSNQDVVDICYKHRDDPDEACREVIQKSHKEWLLNDDCGEDQANYDDMTCVVIFFDHPGDDAAGDANADGVSSPPPKSKSHPTERPHRQGKRVRQKTLENLDEMGK